MADNYQYDPGSSATAAGDLIGTVMYPRVKVALGLDGAANLDLANGQASMANSLPVAIASDQSTLPVAGAVTISGTATVSGDAANGASDTGNPVKTGGLAKTANPTAVTDGQRVNSLHDKLGKQVVVGSIRDLKGQQQTTITTSTSETTIVTAVASTFLDLYGLILTNISATGVYVTIKDSTAGTTRAVIYVPAGDTRGFMLPESGAIAQSAVNNNWTATCSGSITSLYVTALFVKNI